MVVDVFSHLTPHQLDQLKSCATEKTFPPGAFIVREGEASYEPLFLRRGQVRLQRQTPYGQFTLTTLDAGELLGELSFIDREQRSIDACAETECDVLILSSEELSSLAEKDQAFNVALYWAFWKSLSTKLRNTNVTLASFFTEAHDNPTMDSFLGRPSGEIDVDVATKRVLFEEQKLSNMEINFLSTLSKAKRLKPGQVIFREGDAGDLLFVVLEGRVMISKQIPGAGEEALAFLERGDFFGEMGLIDRKPRSADAKADQNGAVVLTISKDVLDMILDIKKISSVRLLTHLCLRLSKRLREVNEKIIGWYILSGGNPGAEGGNPG